MSLRQLLIASGALLVAIAAAAQDKPAIPATTYLLKADHVFDARSEATHAGWAVLVEGGKIAAVGPRDSIKAPADAQTIDLPGTTLLPGLIDAHSHIFLHPYNETLWNDQVLKEPLAYRTIEAVNHVRDTLMAGFTALRDLGTEGAGYADVDVQRAIDEGLIPGPHLFVATRATVAKDCYGPGPMGFRTDM
ncbi:MAG TPA: amidohydrolase family protein, partial [Rhodanobacteraceae bacterium]|nr:amidohydrolase family protein [Rhodanobacteraceae bacterium]